MLSFCNEKCSSYRLMCFLGTVWECSGPEVILILVKSFAASHTWPIQQLCPASRWDKSQLFILLSRSWLQLLWIEGIHDLIWPGSQFWQLGDQARKGQCQALSLLHPFSVTFMGDNGEFQLGSKFENSGCLKDFFFFFSPSHAKLCFHGNRNENLLAACRQAADDSSQYQISAVDFQITVLRTHCNNKYKDFTTILAPLVCLTLKQRENG